MKARRTGSRLQDSALIIGGIKALRGDLRRGLDTLHTIDGGRRADQDSGPSESPRGKERAHKPRCPPGFFADGRGASRKETTVVASGDDVLAAVPAAGTERIRPMLQTSLGTVRRRAPSNIGKSTSRCCRRT